jgi:hypothetical protein
LCFGASLVCLISVLISWPARVLLAGSAGFLSVRCIIDLDGLEAPRDRNGVALGGDPRSDQAATCGRQHFAEVYVADHGPLSQGRTRRGDVQGYRTVFISAACMSSTMFCPLT